MDSSAYLTRHGWRGEGHSLHPTGRGIKKPLLVSKKSNALGVGKKNNDIHADQWWARAFDSGLKALDVNRNESQISKTGAVKEALSALELVKNGGGKWAGLYSGFIKGQGLEGTVEAHASSDNSVRDQRSTGHLEFRAKRLKDQARTSPPTQDLQEGNTQSHTSRDQPLSRYGINQESSSTAATNEVLGKLERKERRRLRRARRLDRELAKDRLATDTSVGSPKKSSGCAAGRSRTLAHSGTYATDDSMVDHDPGDEWPGIDVRGASKSQKKRRTQKAPENEGPRKQQLEVRKSRKSQERLNAPP